MRQWLAYARFRTILLVKGALMRLLCHWVGARRSIPAGRPAEVVVVLDPGLGLGDALMISPALRHLAGCARVTVLTRLPDFMETGDIAWQVCRDDAHLACRMAEAAQAGIPLFVPRMGLRTLLISARLRPAAALAGLTADDMVLDSMAGTVRPSRHRHYTDGIMAALGVFCAAAALPPPPAVAPARIAPRRADAPPPVAPGNPLIALAPWAHGATRRWPMEHFSRLVDLVQERLPEARFALIGGSSAAEIAAGERIRALAARPERVENHMGRHSLAETCALIAASDAMVACDNGPMHLAIGLDVPLLALFGCTAPDSRMAGAIARALWDPALCPTERAPCHRPLVQNVLCPTGLECMTGLTPEAVTQALLALPSRQPPLSIGELQ